MRKHLTIISFFTLLALLASPHLYAADTDSVETDSIPQEYAREYTEEHPLVYEDAFDIWPYAFNDDKGIAMGFNVELVDILLNQLGIPHVTKLKVRADVLKDIKDKRADLTLGMQAPFNEEYTIFGKQVISLFTHSVVWPKGEQQPITTFEDIENHQVFVHYGSFSHYLIEKQGWGNSIRTFEDMESAVKKVGSEGKGQVLWNTAALKWLIRANHLNKLQIAPVTMPDGEYKFMSNDQLLLHKLDSLYSKLRNDGRVVTIRNKWFYPEKQNSGIPTWVWHILNILVVLAIFLTTIIFYVRYRENKANARSKQRNSRLALIMRASGTSIWLYDVVKQCFIWINNEGIPTHNYTLEQFTSRLDKESHDLVISSINDIVSKKSENISLDINTFAESDPTGGVHTYAITLSVVREKEGKPIVIMAVCNDITEKNKNLRETKERLIRYRSIFNTAIVDMIYFDRDGYIANMNERAQETLQMSLDETISNRVSLRQIIDIPDFNYDTFDYYNVTRFINYNGVKNSIISRKLTKPIVYNLQIVPVRDKDGNLLCAYETGMEITETVDTYRNLQRGIRKEKEANKELIDYIDNINYVMEVGGVRIATYSPDTHILSINKSHNIVQHELTQTRVMSLTADISQKAVMRALNNMDNRSKTTIEAEVCTTLRAGGKPLYLLLRFVPTLDSEGNVISYFGMCRDISTIKATEAMLEKETVKAHEIETLKNSFLRNMSYEIRTPLNSVVGFSELFEQPHSPEDEVLFINEIKSSSTYLLDLINDILFLSRLDAHMIEYNVQPTDFALSFEGHCYVGWANQQKEGVEYIVENRFDKIIVNIDDTNIGRVIEQVIANATKHTDSGFVRARYDYVGDRLMIVIEDTGSGIAPDVLKHIYERFASGNNNGTGLGLPICKEIIEQMNGKIYIFTKEGKGTTVCIIIPCEAITIERKKIF